MKLGRIAAGIVVLAQVAIGAATIVTRDDKISNPEHAVKQLVAAIERKALAELGKRDKSSGCTTDNIVYRQE